MDFKNFPDLDDAQVIDKELNPLGFDPSEYPTLQDMLHSHQFNSDEVHPIDLVSLSVNGTVVRDEMQKYLDKKANSSSALKEVLKTPFHYFFYTNQRHKDKKKDHFELGTFAHMAFLEEELFDKFIIQPNHPLNSTVGVTDMIRWFECINQVPSETLDGKKMPELRAYLDELRQSCEYQLIDEEHQVIIDAVRQGYNLYGGGIIKRILKGAVSETSFYGKDPVTGLPVKVRPDYFNVKENIGVDAVISFKTTSAQTLGKFLYDTAKFQYELSEGMYQKVMSDITGRQFNVTIMIMLQTVPPYLPAVFIWTPEDLANGKYKYRFALDTIKECQDKMIFPGFDAAAESGNAGIIELEQPEWSAKLLHPVDIDE
ncbi:PDDEXK-like protein of unknown function [Chitinophaga jiangningensis]|uniref:Putative exodeoxyribonuclease 8 PDDEXK-like domain-containing protein n=1 Tax=Chitinophaga jiangningensis TaxID=1419482 RepID=A0A1M6WJ49_9BACT|nr:PD-(D/E)XK nuclease-like domain-containing protein [Chitinophaga jiangningensis]SHK93644.1 PDDEXK-like protein of unknown function [Chitinophaga jiangningensis]